VKELRNILKLDNGAKEPILAFCMTTFNGFILLIDALNLITIETKRIVGIEKKQSLHQMNEYLYSYIYLMYHNRMSHPKRVPPYVHCLSGYIIFRIQLL
jgi:hypothetical protein